MSDFVSDEVFKALEGKIDKPDSVFVLEEMNASSLEYEAISVMLERTKAQNWVEEMGTTNINFDGIDHHTNIRRYRRLRIIY